MKEYYKKIDRIIDEIIEETGLQREEVEKRTEEIKLNFKGLISDESALFMIAKEFGIQLETQNKSKQEPINFTEKEKSIYLTEKEVYGDTINTEIFTYSDEYVTKLDYSCTCRIETKEKLSKKITCECKFQGFLPSLGQRIPEEHASPDYRFHRELARDLTREELQELEEADDHKYFEEEFYSSRGIPIFTGFTASFNVDKKTSMEEIKPAIKQWCQDLVAYYIFPQVKVSPYWDGYIIEETKPKKFPFEGRMTYLLSYRTDDDH